MTGEHLSAEALVDLADGVLPEAERERAAAHLEACDACRGELDVLRGEPASDLERARAARSAVATIPRLRPGGRLAAVAASDEGLPDPAQGVFLCRFDDADLEVYGFDREDGYRLVIYYPDRAAFGGVQAEALAEQRAFPTGWVGRLRGAGEQIVEASIDYGGVTYSLSLLGRAK
jgi:hypothetical protein